MKTSRRSFVQGAAGAAAAPMFGGCRIFGDSATVRTPNYWCTWATQARTIDAVAKSGETMFPGDQGLPGCRDNLDEKTVFGKKARTLLKSSDVFRIYDLSSPIFYPTAIERAFLLLETAEQAGASTFINVEDVLYLAASLGCSAGIMRAPVWAEPERDVTNRHKSCGEATRLVAWQRMAPAFGARADVPIGVFGRFHTLAFDCRDKGATVYARDLAGREEHDITAKCRFEPGRVIIPGDILEKIGTEAIGDMSMPGAAVRVTG